MQHKSVHAGFGLLEAMIAILLAAIALLGLAAAQARALQFASSSLYSTIAVIQAQNAVERIWPSLCALQQGSPYDAAFVAALLPQPEQDPELYQLELPDSGAFHFTTAPDTSHATSEYLVCIRWQDRRMQDGQANELELVASFPWLRNGGGCE